MNQTHLDLMYKELRNAISTRLDSFGLPLLSNSKSTFDKNKDPIESTDAIFKTKTGRNRKSTSAMMRALITGVGRGVGQELADLGMGKRTGGIGINVGAFLDNTTKYVQDADQDMQVKNTTDNIILFINSSITYDTE